MLKQAQGQCGAVRRRLEAFRYQGSLGGVFKQYRVARQKGRDDRIDGRQEGIIPRRDH